MTEPYARIDKHVDGEKEIYPIQTDDRIRRMYQDIALARLDIYMEDCVSALVATESNRLN